MNRLEEIEYARFHALAQLIADKEKGVEAFSRYMKIAFPGFESRKRAQDDEVKKQLKEWVNSGPLKVTPLPMPTGRSRLKTRSARVTKDERGEKIYSRLTNKMRGRSRG